MKTHLKNILKQIIHNSGYDIKKLSPSSYYLKSCEEIFCKDPSQFLEIMVHNRKTLSLVDEWISDDTYNNSFWQYGIPRGNKSINNIEKNITYTDMIIFLSSYLRKNINYLEIGVSAGKNFIQLCNSYQESTLTGMDIEEINPTLEKLFDSKQILSKWDEDTEFKDYKGEPRQKTSSLTKYNFPVKNNIVYYLSANKFNENTWKKLSCKKFNLIFSDAYHEPISLKNEMEMFKKYSLIDEDEFVIIYDDLNGKMMNTFLEIGKELSDLYKLNSKCIFILKVHGSYGYGSPHDVGVIFKLSDLKM